MLTLQPANRTYTRKLVATGGDEILGDRPQAVALTNQMKRSTPMFDSAQRIAAAFDTKAAEKIMPGVTKRAEGFADSIEKTKASSLEGALENAVPALNQKIADGTATPEYVTKFVTMVHNLAFQIAVKSVMIATIADTLRQVGEKSLANEESDALQPAGGAA